MIQQNRPFYCDHYKHDDHYQGHLVLVGEVGGVEKVFDGGAGRGALLRQVGHQVDRDHQLPQKDHFRQTDHFHNNDLVKRIVIMRIVNLIDRE